MKFDIRIHTPTGRLNQALIRITRGTTINFSAQTNTHRTLFVQHGAGHHVQEKSEDDTFLEPMDVIIIDPGETISLIGATENRVFTLLLTSTSVISENCVQEVKT